PGYNRAKGEISNSFGAYGYNDFGDGSDPPGGGGLAGTTVDNGTPLPTQVRVRENNVVSPSDMIATGDAPLIPLADSYGSLEGDFSLTYGLATSASGGPWNMIMYGSPAS